MGLRGFAYVVAAVATAVAGLVAAGHTAGAAANATATSTSVAWTTDPAPEVVLPDPTRTPGVFNRAVRQRTIRRTICVRGWTKKVRPPVRFTNALKLRQMEQYGETGSPSAYEEDHLIPLELGGAPANPRNLWPEPRFEARTSDPLETSLKRAVCRGRVTLARARITIRAFKFAHG